MCGRPFPVGSSIKTQSYLPVSKLVQRTTVGHISRPYTSLSFCSYTHTILALQSTKEAQQSYTAMHIEPRFHLSPASDARVTTSVDPIRAPHPLLTPTPIASVVSVDSSAPIIGFPPKNGPSGDALTLLF